MTNVKHLKKLGTYYILHYFLERGSLVGCLEIH